MASNLLDVPFPRQFRAHFKILTARREPAGTTKPWRHRSNGRADLLGASHAFFLCRHHRKRSVRTANGLLACTARLGTARRIHLGLIAGAVPCLQGLAPAVGLPWARPLFCRLCGPAALRAGRARSHEKTGASSITPAGALRHIPSKRPKKTAGSPLRCPWLHLALCT